MELLENLFQKVLTPYNKNTKAQRIYFWNEKLQIISNISIDIELKISEFSFMILDNLKVLKVSTIITDIVKLAFKFR